MNARFVSLLAALLSLISPAWSQGPAPRPEKWAQRVETEGLPNFHRVTPQIFRSAQPTAEGLRAAEKLGIRTVLCLRADMDDAPLAVGTRLRLRNIPMELGAANEEALLSAVAMLAAPGEGPILVHCQMGADRTGAVFALYRVLVQDWTREEALRELCDGGYGFGLEEFAKFLVNADLARLRKAFAERLAREKAGR